MAEASEPIVLPYNKSGSDVRGSIHDLAGYEHIHTAVRLPWVKKEANDKNV